MKINIGLKPKNNEKVIELLNKLLCDEYTIYTKTLNYHWNVKSAQFHDLHAFFKAQYEAIFDYVDDVAERARSLGGRSFGTLHEFKHGTRLEEKPGTVPSAHTMLKNLLEDHEAIIRLLRTDLETCVKLEDMGTNNFLTDLMEKHEKLAWMLRAAVYE